MLMALTKIISQIILLIVPEGIEIPFSDKAGIRNYLLIVPEGIEIFPGRQMDVSVDKLLIVPEGIEMSIRNFYTYCNRLLIVPEGIEI